MIERDKLSVKGALIKQLNYAIDKFDFKMVEAFYRLMKWRWCGDENPPTSEKISSTALSLGFAAINEFISTGRASKVTSGGISVHIFEWDSSYELEIVFVPVSAASSTSKRDI